MSWQWTDSTLTYNAYDAAVTREIWEPIQHSMDTGGYRQAYSMTMRLLDPLTYMMTRGIRVDMKALEATRRVVDQRIDAAQLELNELCGRPLNPNSPKDCQGYFYIEKGIKPYLNKGRITTDDKAMQRIARGTAARPGLREARLVQEIRGLRKLRGTYLDIQFDADGRLRCAYNPRGTKFGRLSSSKTIFGTGMNMQNLPEQFQRFLVPDPGYVMLDLDKRQAEWVVVAYLSGDARMIQVIEEGADPHARTASLMFGVSEEVIALEAKAVGHSTDPGEVESARKSLLQGARDELEAAPFLIRNMSLRQAGKKSNHGLNYDEGYRTFALQNEIPEADAKRIVALYHQAYPGIRQWHEHIRKQLNRDRTLENCYGRRIKFFDAWGPDLWKAAYSAIPQSTVVDLINEGMAEIYEDRNASMRYIELLMQVHDSIRFQYPLANTKPNGRLERTLDTCFDYLNPELEYGGQTFRIATDLKVGFNGADMVECQIPDVMSTIGKLQKAEVE